MGLLTGLPDAGFQTTAVLCGRQFFCGEAFFQRNRNNFHLGGPSDGLRRERPHCGSLRRSGAGGVGAIWGAARIEIPQEVYAT